MNENIARGNFFDSHCTVKQKTAPFYFCNSFVKTSYVTTFLVDIR